jgi:hypothetical protein
MTAIWDNTDFSVAIIFMKDFAKEILDKGRSKLCVLANTQDHEIIAIQIDGTGQSSTTLTQQCRTDYTPNHWGTSPAETTRSMNKNVVVIKSNG